MSIKMSIEGEVVEVDTEEEVLMLLRAKQRFQAEKLARGVTNAPTGMGIVNGGRGMPRPALENGPVQSKWDELMAALNPNQRGVLRYVKANDGTKLDDMSAAIAEGKNSTIAGLWTGITRNAEKLGVRMPQLIRREAKGTGPNRVIRYFAGPLLRANEVPDA